MSRNSDFHQGPAQAWTAVTVKLTPGDREALKALTHAHGKTASDVIRDLIRSAVVPGVSQ